MTAPPVDVSRARISSSLTGSYVLVDDPDSPWQVRVWVAPAPDGRPAIRRLRIDVRDQDGDITAVQLARLPVAQLRQVAAAEAGVSEHPNETYYRMLARPRPRDGWGDEHWRAVLEVYGWAEDTGRDGGGVRAVAELWGVTVRPTAYRWLAEARRRERERVDD